VLQERQLKVSFFLQELDGVFFNVFFITGIRCLGQWNANLDAMSKGKQLKNRMMLPVGFDLMSLKFPLMQRAQSF